MNIAEESKKKWETVADWWFEQTKSGDLYQNTLIVPVVDELLNIAHDENVLDVGCGGGHYPVKMAMKGAKVTAFDFCEKFIEKAKIEAEEKSLSSKIEYLVIDACNSDELEKIEDNKFNIAVSLMALQDMYNIQPLAEKLYKALKKDAGFVFAVPHPCFNNDAETKDNSVEIKSYNTFKAESATAKPSQPSQHLIWSRSISYYLNTFTDAGFAVDKIVEPVFNKENISRFPKIWMEIPSAFIVRLKK